MCICCFSAHTHPWTCVDISCSSPFTHSIFSSRPGARVSNVLTQVWLAAFHTRTDPSNEHVARDCCEVASRAQQQSKMVSVCPGCVHHSCC